MKNLSPLSLRCWASVSLAAIITSLSITTTSGQTLAALDTQDNPRCAKDGACNLAVCSVDEDPDCRDLDLPPGAGADPVNPTTTISLETINCNDTQDVDILAVAWNIVDDWTNFDAAIQRQTSFNLGNCTHDRFSSNGRVECMARDHCTGKGCRQGYSVPTQQRIRIYPDFLTRIAGLPAPDKRACIAALMTHEFAHSCSRFEGRAEAREDAAFDYWQARFPGTSGFDINDTDSSATNDCGLD
jgi:hypothetical protein